MPSGKAREAAELPRRSQHSQGSDAYEFNNLPATGTAGLRSDTDVWFKKYEEAKELAAEVLTLIQVSPFAEPV